MLKCGSLYNAGLSSASCGIVVSVAYGKRTFIVHVEPQHRRLAQTSMIAGLAAALGIFWQALIPLQHDIGEVIRGRAEISPQSMLHQLGSIHQNPTTASVHRAAIGKVGGIETVAAAMRANEAWARERRGLTDEGRHTASERTPRCIAGRLAPARFYPDSPTAR